MFDGYARQNDLRELFIRTIGIARTETSVGLADLAYNIDSLILDEPRAATGCLRLIGTICR